MGEVREGKSPVVVNPVGEGALRQVLKEYGTHYHPERNHQGRGNELLMPLSSQEALGTTSIHACERVGGLLKDDYREAA